MITIAGQRVESLNQLSPSFLALLGMIPDGEAWLTWAMGTNVPQSIVAQEEGQLLDIIIEGLHLDGYIRFNAFRADPYALLQCSPEDLQYLAKVHNTGSDSGDDLDPFLNANNLVSYSQLGAVNDWLTRTKQIGEAPFQSIGFSEQLALYHMLNNQPTTSTKMKTEALEFARAVAYTVGEYIDYLGFYLAAGQRLRKNMSAAMRNIDIQGYFKQLLPLCNYLIYAPNVGNVHTDDQLREAIVTCAASVVFVGFSTKAAAMNNLVRNIPLDVLEDDEAAKEAIETYLIHLKNHLLTADIPDCTFSQDGGVRSITIDDAHFHIKLEVSKDGLLTLGPETMKK